MYRDTSSVDYAPRELTHACSDFNYKWYMNLTIEKNPLKTRGGI